MKNNKGFTLVELVVSICLISVVMFFMYELLNDIKFEGSNDYIATSNVNNRIEIEDTIHKYLSECSYIKEPEVNDNIISFKDTDYTVELQNNSNNSVIYLKELDSVKRKWTIDNASFDLNPICENEISDNNQYGVVTCNLKVYTNNTKNNKENNNTLDDISISYIYDKLSTRIVDEFDLFKYVKVNNYDATRVNNTFSYNLNDHREIKKDVEVQLTDKYSTLKVSDDEGNTIDVNCNDRNCKFLVGDDKTNIYTLKAIYRENTYIFDQTADLIITGIKKNFEITILYKNENENEIREPFSNSCDIGTNFSLTIPEITGYAFTNIDKIYNTSQYLQCTEDKTYNIYYKLRNFNVTYELNGGTNNSDNPESFTIDDYDFTLKDPTKANNEFLGWYKDSGYTQEITNIKDAINLNNPKNITLYAKFTPNRFKITLSAAGASTNPTTIRYVNYLGNTLNDSIDNPQKFFTASGFTTNNLLNSLHAVISSTNDISSIYRISGWYTAPEGGIKVLTEATSPIFLKGVENYTDSEGKWIRKQDTTLYAHWNSGTPVTFPTITKTGHTCGWTSKLELNAPIEINSGASVTLTSNKTYYGVCIPNQYTITYYDASGNKLNTENYTYSGAEYTLWKPTDSSYVYYGWYTSRDNATNQSGTKYTSFPGGTTGNKTYYAKKVSSTNNSTLSNTTSKNNNSYQCKRYSGEGYDVCLPNSSRISILNNTYTLSATVKEISYDIKNNTSTIEYSLNFKSNISGMYYTRWKEKFVLYVNGNPVPESDTSVKHTIFNTYEIFNNQSTRIKGTMTINRTNTNVIEFYAVRDSRCSGDRECCSSNEWKKGICYGSSEPMGYSLPYDNYIETPKGTLTLTSFNKNYLK